jgi:tetratricopeptide (TPR) repeat protein
MDEQLKQGLLLGREHFQKQEYDKAEAYLNQVLTVDDRFADVHDMLGLIAHSRGNYQGAEDHFTRALAINPSYTEAALNLAVTLNDRGKYKEARAVYEKIQGKPSGAIGTLDPFARGKLANMHADLAQAYADSGLPREAVGELEKAVRLCPQFADLRTKLGNFLRELGDLGAARLQYEAAIEARPSYVPARIHLGVTLLALKQIDAAAEQWRKALEIEPENHLAGMYMRMLERSPQSQKS